MSSPFVAEIRMFGCNFAPTGWASCDGQILPISQNTALFSLLGTTYGGDGKSTFALPNLQGSAPMQWGQGPGLTLRDLGEVGGTSTVTLLNPEMPSHPHTMNAYTFDPGDNRTPGPALSMAKTSPGNAYQPVGNVVPMNPQTLAIVGSSLPHNNMQPYLVVFFCIALQGIFPSRP